MCYSKWLDYCHIYRGCRQGDPLSLFYLYAEILALLLKKNNQTTTTKTKELLLMLFYLMIQSI